MTMTNEERLEMVADTATEYEKKINAVQRDPDLSGEGKQKKLVNLHAEREDAVDHAREKAFEDIDFQLEKQREKATPKPPKKPTTQTELMAAILDGQNRDRAERRLTAKWNKSGPDVDEYRRAVSEGDDLTADLFEDLAESYGGNASLRMEIASGRDRRAEAALPESVKTARANVAELERDRAMLDMSITALMRREARRLEMAR